METSIAFTSTESLYAWEQENRRHFSGPFSVFDAWTYGHCEFRPDPLNGGFYFTTV